MAGFLKNLLIAAVFVPTVLTSQPAAAQFLDAAGVRPILNATKANWIAVREFGSNDILYFTHLMAWRCGLEKVEYSINSSEIDQEMPIGECNEDAPNTIPDELNVYVTFELKSVNSVTVKITYDDGETDTQTYERAKILQ